MRKYNFLSWHAWLSVALSCLLLRSWLLPLRLQQYSASSSSLRTTHSRSFFFFILLLKLNVLLQGVRLVLQWKLQVHFILNIRAFELREGEKKRKGQNYIPISMSFSPTRPKRVPDLRYLCALFDLKLLKSMSNILGFHSREFFWTPENLSVMKSALPSRGSFQGRNIINPK